MSGWSVLFWLIVTFLLLHPLNRWISTHVQGVAFLLTGNINVAMWFFWVLFLPGTLLHEVSHWLTANLLRVKTGRLTLWPKYKRGGQLQMGAVQVDVADPFRHSLIGLAPLIFGSVAVLIIGLGWLDLEQIGLALTTGNLETIWQAVVDTLSVPDIWLWLYLIFAISNAMLPSTSDRESWRAVLIYVGLAILFAVGLGVIPTITPQFQEFGITVLTYLLSAFTITIAVDIFFIILILLAEIMISWILGRRVQYNR
ncbi:MAG: hypothetical protein OES12_04955 [Anaerolineae bacterium]|nr:hypothetical protein [Anaerolineae bacterium]